MTDDNFLTELELGLLQRNVACRDALEQRVEAMFGEQRRKLDAWDDEWAERFYARTGLTMQDCVIELETGRILPPDALADIPPRSGGAHASEGPAPLISSVASTDATEGPGGLLEGPSAGDPVGGEVAPAPLKGQVKKERRKPGPKPGSKRAAKAPVKASKRRKSA